MNEDEMQKTIRFILSEQAKVTTGLESLTGNVSQMQRMMTTMATLFDRERKDLREKLTMLTDAQIKADEQAQDFRREGRQFRADVGQAMTMLENSQDRLAAAMIESEKRQQRLEEAVLRLTDSQKGMQTAMGEMAAGTEARDKALAEMMRAITKTSQRVDTIEENGTKR